jgi:hypothetical protein
MSDEQESVKQDVVKVESDEEESVYSGTGSGSDESSAINIDLTENNIYQGICTLFEDEEGNNILQYININIISVLYESVINDCDYVYSNMIGPPKEVNENSDINLSNIHF